MKAPDISHLTVSIGASETETGHKIFIESPDGKENLLERKEIDELGREIVLKNVLSMEDVLNEEDKHVLVIEI